MERFEKTLQLDNSVILPVFGQFDANIKQVERACGVQIVNRGDDVKIVGAERGVRKAWNVVSSLAALAAKGEEITEQNLNYFLASAEEADLKELEKVYDDLICVTANGRHLKPKTLGQKKYVDLMKNNTVVFGIGPAGTGKTYLAMAMAITAFKNNEVSRIILTRPAIAGIMGAFGAALAARDLRLEHSSLLDAGALEGFAHTAKPVTCNLCTNHCSLTVNSFDGGRR